MVGVLRHTESQDSRADARDGVGPAGEWRAKACCAAGFSALLAWLCLYWGVLALNDVEIYNHALFAAASHAATFVALLVIYAAVGRAKSASISESDRDAEAVSEKLRRNASKETRVTAALCCLSGALLLAYLLAGGAFLAALSSTAFGVASALAGVFWVHRISGARVRFSFTCAICAMLASVLVCLALQMVGGVFSIALCIVLPAVSSLFAFAEPPVSPSKNAIDGTSRKHLPWPFLSALFACCATSAFFVGLTTDPYAFQSKTVVHWWLVLACAVLFSLFVFSRIVRRADVRAFFLASLAFLLVISHYSAKNAPVSLLVRRVGERAMPIACIGLLFGDGIVARGIGMLVNNNFKLDFPMVATAASALIALFALFYAFATSATQRGEAVVPVVLDESDDRAGDFLDSFDFTAQEQRVASCIIGGMKYREIAEELDLSERTVKFHAKHAFEKVGVSRRDDFEQRARDWK